MSIESPDFRNAGYARDPELQQLIDAGDFTGAELYEEAQIIVRSETIAINDSAALDIDNNNAWPK